MLFVKALLLPVLLVLTVRRTREPGRLTAERLPLARLALAGAAAMAIVELVPRFGLDSAGAEHAAVGLVALGI